MADFWDNPDIWNAPVDNTTPTTDGSTPAPAAAATPSLKAKSWGSSTSASSTQVPEWLGTSLQNLWGKRGNLGLDWIQNANQKYFANGPAYQPQANDLVSQLSDVWNQQKNLPGSIEQQRQNMINQIYAGRTPMQQLYQPALDQMSQRGILNSSITGDALTNIQNQQNRDIEQQTAAANTWAGNQNINAITSMPQTLQGIIGSLMGAQAQNANFGKDAAAMGTGYQGLMNNFLDALKAAQAKSEQTSGSETYNV